MDDAVTGATGGFPELWQVVIDTTDPRRLAEFYRRLLGLSYRSGDEPPPPGEPDPLGADWLVLDHPDGYTRVAFQRVDTLPAATWPAGPHPQQLHLDLRVPSRADLDRHHERAVALGATEILDRTDDPDEALRVYRDPAGHPFCLFVRAGPADTDGGELR
jgi:catechol 2,3-dioxygenase-like lactoylglutathione lyase family enzyme